MAEATPRKKGVKVQIAYLDESGQAVEGRSIPKGVTGLLVTVPEAAVNERVLFESFPDAEHVLTQAAAFGLATIFRNCVNTAEEGAAEGGEVFLRRLASLRAGVWSTAGEGGGGEPMILTAIKATLLDSGHTAEQVEEKMAELAERWDGFTPKQRKEQQTAWMTKGPIASHYNRLRAEELQARLDRAKAAQKAADGNTAEAQLEDL
jgi:hypothetical protein